MSSRRDCRMAAWAAAMMTLVLAGCGADSGPELAVVNGRITLDDQPLPDAWVRFEPREGRPSYGRTDSDGRYSLAFTADKPGAVVGEHVVRIGTRQTVDAQGQVIPEALNQEEQIPAIYNTDSTLVVQIEPGENAIDIPLTSQ